MLHCVAHSVTTSLFFLVRVIRAQAFGLPANKDEVTMEFGVLREAPRVQQVAQLVLVAAALDEDNVDFDCVEIERFQNRELRPFNVD